METANQTLLARFAVAISVFALIMVAVVGTRPHKDDATAATTTAGPVKVALSEFAISPAALTVPKGGSLAVTNNGTMTHNLAVTGTALKIADLAPGGTSTLDVSSLSPGDYEVFCAIAGHKDSGMTAKLTVTDGSAASLAAAEADAAESSSGGHDMAAMNDVGTMEPTDPAAERINKEMEQAMTAGVKSFLSYADQYAAGSIKTGNTKLVPKVSADGTKNFYLTAAITDWEVSPGKVVKAWTYNDQVPGAWIRVEPGDKVAVHLRNQLPISTDIHWHGISVPNDQDGLAPITQDYIKPLTSYTYRFTAPDHNELGMYHAHMHGQVAIVNGLFGLVQVGDVPLPKGRTFDGVTVPQDIKIAQEIPMVLNDAGVIGLTLNGKGFPETAPIVANKGDWLLIHFYNEGLQGHPMHLHRQSQLVVAKDGFALDSPYREDTLWVAPGERYSVLVKAEEVGTWAFHCHIVSHAESDQGLTGMVTALIVKP
jgi:FtsP/CotA-like multicopper oxidase with cupredoxin domain